MIKLSIKDVPWTFEVLDDDDYEKKHGKDSHGITDKYELTVDFKRSSFSLKLVQHELFHVYATSCCVNSIPNLDDASLEELGAEIVEFHLADLSKHSKKIHTTLESSLKKRNTQKKDLHGS